MGSGSDNIKSEYQQQQGNRLSVPSLFEYLGFPINTRMVEAKMILSILNFIGYGLFGYTLFINLDNVKGWILMIIGTLFGLAKLYFYIRRSIQAVDKAKQEEELRHLDILRKHREDKAIELKQLEDELSLRITGMRDDERKDSYKKYD